MPAAPIAIAWTASPPPPNLVEPASRPADTSNALMMPPKVPASRYARRGWMSQKRSELIGCAHAKHASSRPSAVEKTCAFFDAPPAANIVSSSETVTEITVSPRSTSIFDAPVHFRRLGPELTDRCSELRRFSFAFITFFRPESTPQLSCFPRPIDDGLLVPLPTSDGDRRDSIRPSLRVGVRLGGGGCGPVRLRSTPSAKEARRRRSAVSIFLRVASAGGWCRGGRGGSRGRRRRRRRRSLEGDGALEGRSRPPLVGGRPPLGGGEAALLDRHNLGPLRHCHGVYLLCSANCGSEGSAARGPKSEASSAALSSGASCVERKKQDQ